MEGRYCVLRTRSAGVHIGLVESISPSPSALIVHLKEARRLYRWREERLSLHEVSSIGGRPADTLSIEIPEILIPEVIEILPCSEQAERTFRTLPAKSRDEE